LPRTLQAEEQEFAKMEHSIKALTTAEDKKATYVLEFAPSLMPGIVKKDVLSRLKTIMIICAVKKDITAFLGVQLSIAHSPANWNMDTIAVDINVETADVLITVMSQGVMNVVASKITFMTLTKSKSFIFVTKTNIYA
jgi:hypothetical protein